jgi:hypothetical protein
MTGGTVVIRRHISNSYGSSGTQTPYDIWIKHDGLSTKSITGGTFQFGDGSTPASQTFGLSSAISVHNIVVNTTNGPTLNLLTLTDANDITISGGTLDAGNAIAGSQDITVRGNWLQNGSFTRRTSTVTFNGSSAQAISGSGNKQFNNLTVDNTSDVDLSSDITVNGILGRRSRRCHGSSRSPLPPAR